MKLTLLRFGAQFMESEPLEYFVYLVGVFSWVVSEDEDIVDDDANTYHISEYIVY